MLNPRNLVTAMLRELRWPIAAALIIAAAAVGPGFAAEATAWVRAQLDAPPPAERGALDAKPAAGELDAAREHRPNPVES